MFHGSIVALVTPMDEEGRIAFEALDRLIDFHIDSGSDAIVAVGTTGESATLNFDEHCEVIRRVVERSAGRTPVIAGTGANSTSEAIELTECAMEAGADAALLVTPYYNKPTQEGLYRHFSLIAERVAIPQLLYNVPGRTGCDLLPETVERLASISNIVGIKEASGTIERMAELTARCGNQLDVLSGEDHLTLEAILAGVARGVISVTANVAPALMHRICSLAVAGDETAARQAHEPIAPLHQALFLESNPIPVKWALHTMGQIPAGIRLPLTPLAAPYRTQLTDALTNAGLLASA